MTSHGSTPNFQPRCPQRDAPRTPRPRWPAESWAQLVCSRARVLGLREPHPRRKAPPSTAWTGHPRLCPTPLLGASYPLLCDQFVGALPPGKKNPAQREASGSRMGWKQGVRRWGTWHPPMGSCCLSWEKGACVWGGGEALR